MTSTPSAQNLISPTPSCLAVMMFAVICSMSGCSSEPVAEVDGGAAVIADGGAAAGVTYADVAPVFERYCVSCHSPGSVGPMDLTTYEGAKTWATAIRVSVNERTMPPWLLTGDGSCGEFKDSAWLPDADVQLINDWVDGGAQPGVATKPTAPNKVEGLSGDGVVELQMPTKYIPTDDKPTGGALFDDYRCFPIQTGLDRDVFVTATQVLPGDPSVVHHVLVFSVNPDAFPVDAPKLGSNAKVMESLQAKHNDRPGWPCFAAAGQGVLMDSLLLAWAPGEVVNHYPAGTGLKLPKGNILVMQIHYNVAKSAPEDQTRIRLAIQDEVERPAWMALHDPFLFSTFGTSPQSIAAGQPNAEVTWNAQTHHLNFWVPSDKTANLEIHGVYPHMHKRGKTMSLERIRGGETQCVAEVKRWDFDWQRMYYLKQPLRFDKGDQLRARCTYDTKDSTAPVMPGFGTAEEMCLMGLYVTTPAK